MKDGHVEHFGTGNRYPLEYTAAYTKFLLDYKYCHATNALISLMY